ncbi:MFS transporter [Mycobacterium sp. BMJ-28]
MRTVYTLIAAYLGLFVGLIDSNAVNLALPAIRTEFGGGVSGAQWAADAYNVAFAAVLLAAGTAGDRFGRRRLLRLGVGLFAVASLACAVAPDLGALLAARVLQGVAAGVMLPQGLAIAAAAFPDTAGRAKATAAWAMAAASSTALGPVIGGVLTDTLGVTATTALTAVVVLTGAAFVWWQRPTTEPTIPADLARNRQLRVGLGATCAMTFGVYALMWLNSLAFQQDRGASALAAALWFLPLPLTYLVLIPVVSRVVRRTGPRIPMTIGLTLMGAGILAYAGVGPHADILVLAAVFVIVGAGLAFNTGPAVTTVLSAVPVHRAGLASGLANLARLIGVTMGIAVVGTVSEVAGVRAALLVGGIVELAGAVLAYVGGRSVAGSPRQEEVCHA